MNNSGKTTIHSLSKEKNQFLEANSLSKIRKSSKFYDDTLIKKRCCKKDIKMHKECTSPSYLCFT